MSQDKVTQNNKVPINQAKFSIFRGKMAHHKNKMKNMKIPHWFEFLCVENELKIM
jgi:hypothetical protein